MPLKVPNPLPPTDVLDDVAAELCRRLDIHAAGRAAAAAILRDALAARDLHLVKLDDKRAPGSAEFMSRTPAGLVRFTGQDHDGMGIKVVHEAMATGTAMVSMMTYQTAGQLGAWLVARAVWAEAKRDRELAKCAGYVRED